MAHIRKEKAARSVETILDSAFKVVSERSLAGSSTSLIAGKAGVSKTLLHYHFKTKDAIMAGVLDRVLDRLLEIPLENSTKNLSALDEIKGIFQRYKVTIAAEPDLLVVFYDFWVRGVKRPEIREKIARRFDAFRSYVSQLVREGVAKGEFSPEKSHMIPPIMLAMLEGASLQLISDPDSFNYDLYQYMALEMITALARK